MILINTLHRLLSAITSYSNFSSEELFKIAWKMEI